MGKSQKSTSKPARRPANPPIGDRSDFLPITVTLSPEMLSDIKALGVKRRSDGIRNNSTSAIIREAVGELLKREG